MAVSTTQTKIDFKPVSLNDKAVYDDYLAKERSRGCEFSFANLYLWGRQNIALLHGHIVLFSQFATNTYRDVPGHI